MLIQAGIPLGGVASLTSEVSVSNSTTDTNILAYTLLAAWPTAGTILRLRAAGNADNGAVAATALNLWLKNGGGTKVLIESLPTPDFALQLTKAWWVEIEIAIRSVGSSGTYLVSIKGSSDLPAPNQPINYIPPDATPADLIAIDTTASATFTFGFNWGAANAGHVARCKTAEWSLVRRP